MKAELARRALDLFRQALDLEPNRRTSFLSDACANDAALRGETESLLRAHGRAGAFLDTPAPLSISNSLPPIEKDDIPAGALVGRKIGRYQVRSLIASGGMGHVYLAEQEAPRRTVAIKVLRAGVLSSASLKRFRHEAQLLARLDHPNIARVYEAGTFGGDSAGAGPVSSEQPGGAGDTVPWFAMEHVADGVPITDYAIARHLGVRQRLEIFARACDAVHHGHQRGILHRDLKPSNILVGETGEPKIIDFGIARATDADMALTTASTDAGQLLGTLQYMSPEQCEADPANLDVRSDVYSLGVVLYELLCERLPYEVGGRSVFSAAHVVREQQPQRPGERDRRLRGDAETICLKALEKERERRYQSTEALARDIRRHLRNEPIEARPPSPIYRARLFVLRNRALVAAALVLFVALVKATVVAALVVVAGLIAVGWIQYRQRLAADRARAEAETVSTYLTSMLGSVDPNTMGQDVTVRQTLDRMTADLERRFGDQPLVEASLRHTIGRAYNGFSLHDDAALHLSIAVRLRERELGHLDGDTLRSMRELSGALMGQGRHEQADQLLDDLYERARRAWGDDHETTLWARTGLGAAAMRRGSYDVAEPLLAETLERCRRVLGPDHDVTLECQCKLASTYMQQYQCERAESVLRHLVEVARRVRGPEGLLALEATNNLGWVVVQLGRLEEAIAILEPALLSCRRVAGREHFETLNAMKYLAQAYRKQGLHEKAEPLVREVVEIFKRVSGPRHPFTLNAMHDLACACVTMERLDEAEDIWLDILGAAPEALGTEHPWILAYMHNLGSLYMREGRFDSAEPILGEALAIVRRTRPDAEYQHGMALMAYGRCLLGLGRYEESEVALRESHTRLRRAGGETGAPARESTEELAKLYDAWGKPLEARAVRRALSSSAALP